MSYKLKRRIENALTFLLAVGFTASLLAAIFVPVTIIINHSAHVDCSRLHDATGYETKTIGVASPTCFVRINNTWVPSDKWIGNTPTDAK